MDKCYKILLTKVFEIVIFVSMFTFYFINFYISFSYRCLEAPYSATRNISSKIYTIFLMGNVNQCAPYNHWKSAGTLSPLEHLSRISNFCLSKKKEPWKRVKRGETKMVSSFGLIISTFHLSFWIDVIVMKLGLCCNH